MLRVLLTLLLIGVPATSQATAITTALAGADLRGSATFRFIGFPLYEARLYTNGGAPLDWGQDFGLELKYMRNIKKADLVDSTMQELERIGRPLPIRSELENCYYDVRKGDRYFAVSKGPDVIEFWLNDRRTCAVQYPGVKASFMGIFLGDNTRSRAFTQRLKGE